MRSFQAAANPINLRVRVYLSAAVAGISRSRHLQTSRAVERIAEIFICAYRRGEAIYSIG
jgi:hypothetical protein